MLSRFFIFAGLLIGGTMAFVEISNVVNGLAPESVLFPALVETALLIGVPFGGLAWVFKRRY